MMAKRPTVVVGLLGTVLDRGKRGTDRWDKWRPSVGIHQQPDLEIARFELLSPPDWVHVAEQVAADVRAGSPATEVVIHPFAMPDPWDFEAVFGALYDFARRRAFDPEAEDLLVHITTGSHVAQICLFLLVESGHLPGRLLQSSPGGSPAGRVGIIDLGLARYDGLARRFDAERAEATSALKGGIDTRNPAFNKLIDRIERVALGSDAPILLTGPTGAGKSALARRIYQLKRARHRVAGPLVEVNCATLRGDGAMSALFGHKRGAFTGAVSDRAGLLRQADGGLLFLDEVGELGLDEQAMLLRAIEERRFLPVGADREVASDFGLITGTNRDLAAEVAAGRFREDLLARIELWSFRLPGLAERPEDIAPNVDFELERLGRALGRRVSFNREAREAFLAHALVYPWPRNFRELAGVVERMATLAPGGRIDLATVQAELGAAPTRPTPLPALDRFDRVQLEDVLAVCRASSSLSEAGRALFAVSRERRSSLNDADRLRKYLARFGLDWEGVRAPGSRA
jgi:transcriptional regulatory protein RtcR